MNKTKVTINSNGSVKLEGDFEIVDTAGALTDCRAVRLFHYADVATHPINHFVMDRIKAILSTRLLLLSFLLAKFNFLLVA